MLWKVNGLKYEGTYATIYNIAVTEARRYRCFVTVELLDTNNYCETFSVSPTAFPIGA